MTSLFIGCDHAGVEAKEVLKDFLRRHFPQFKVIDEGTSTAESVHYPDFAKKVCSGVMKNPENKGVLICGTGIGMSIVANRYQKIRAALIYRPQEAALSREHNNANVLCLGARVSSQEDLEKILKTWLETPFAGGRHQERLDRFGDLGNC